MVKRVALAFLLVALCFASGYWVGSGRATDTNERLEQAVRDSIALRGANEELASRIIDIAGKLDRAGSEIIKLRTERDGIRESYNIVVGGIEGARASSDGFSTINSEFRSLLDEIRDRIPGADQKP